MLRNYLKIAVRNLWKYKSFTLINVVGLAIGMATSLLILEYVSFERSYDPFHRQVGKIYRLRYNQVNETGEVTAKAATYVSVDQKLPDAFPEIESVVRFHRSREVVLKV